MIDRKAVAAFILNGNRVLVGKKVPDVGGELSGKWHIPGETLELNETDADALVRGMREEANITVVPGEFLGTHFTKRQTRVNWYLCTTLDNKVQAGSDLVEVHWVPLSEVVDICTPEIVARWPQKVRDLLL